MIQTILGTIAAAGKSIGNAITSQNQYRTQSLQNRQAAYDLLAQDQENPTENILLIGGIALIIILIVFILLKRT